MMKEEYKKVTQRNESFKYIDRQRQQQPKNKAVGR